MLQRLHGVPEQTPVKLDRAPIRAEFPLRHGVERAIAAEFRSDCKPLVRVLLSFEIARALEQYLRRVESGSLALGREIQNALQQERLVIEGVTFPADRRERTRRGNVIAVLEQERTLPCLAAPPLAIHNRRLRHCALRRARTHAGNPLGRRCGLGTLPDRPIHALQHAAARCQHRTDRCGALDGAERLGRLPQSVVAEAP